MGRAKKCDHLVCIVTETKPHRCIVDNPVSTTREQLRAARERANLTQAEAAEIVHMSDDRVWRRWEAGDRGVNEAAAHLFAILTRQPYPYPEAKR